VCQQGDDVIREIDHYSIVCLLDSSRSPIGSRFVGIWESIISKVRSDHLLLLGKKYIVSEMPGPLIRMPCILLAPKFTFRAPPKRHLIWNSGFWLHRTAAITKLNGSKR
jgi:hypothetical protein